MTQARGLDRGVLRVVHEFEGHELVVGKLQHRQGARPPALVELTATTGYGPEAKVPSCWTLGAGASSASLSRCRKSQDHSPREPDMNNSVLITYASHRERTADIASAIGEHLMQRGYEVDVRAISSAPDARLYSAVIIGSTLHMGHWDRHAVAYLKHQAADLAERPTWLFQSEPTEPPRDGDHTATSHAVHRLCFGIGIPDPMIFNCHAPSGDFRDWHEVSTWADEVANRLDASQALLGV
jgi:menaquinone-dependent protoporphyrinogen oxidase